MDLRSVLLLRHAAELRATPGGIAHGPWIAFDIDQTDLTLLAPRSQIHQVPAPKRAGTGRIPVSLTCPWAHAPCRLARQERKLGWQRLPPQPDSPATQGRGGLFRGVAVAIGQGIGDAPLEEGGRKGGLIWRGSGRNYAKQFLWLSSKPTTLYFVQCLARESLKPTTSDMWIRTRMAIAGLP